MLHVSQCSPPTSIVEANAAIPSHLHPVALRSTSNATSANTAAASLLAEAHFRANQPVSPASPLPSPPDSQASDPCEGSECGSSSSSFVSASRPALLESDVAGLSIASSTLAKNQSHSQTRAPNDITGLQVDPSRYPLLSSLQTPQASRSHSPTASTSDVYLLTCAEYVELYDDYLASASEVDESVLFPWLHCSDIPGTPQASYFSDNLSARTAPRYRGLTIVSADPDLGSTRSHPDPRVAPVASHHPQLEPKVYDRARTQSIGGSSTTSSNSIDSAIGSSHSELNGGSSVATTPTSPSTSVVSFDGPEPRASLLCSSLFPHDILERDPCSGSPLGRFLTPQLPVNVNLRLFRQQPSRYVTISDVVVYSESGLSDQAIRLAHTIKVAQDKYFESRGGTQNGALRYHVFLVSEPFETFERFYPQVVAVDGWGYRRNKTDFFEREREEMARLTKASEIGHNVWLGNTSDVPINRQEAPSPRKRSLGAAAAAAGPETVPQTNVPDFTVCIEAHDQAMLNSSHQLNLNQLCVERIFQNKKAQAPACTPTNESCSSNLIHMEVPSTGQSCGGAAHLDRLICGLVELAVWVKKIATASEKTASDGTKILIHCHDGYTETSLFALTYTMYDQHCCLPEAYLYLQNQKARSFFVYPADVQILRRVEARIEQLLQEQRRPGHAIINSRPLSNEEGHRSFLKGRVPFGLSSVGNRSLTLPTPAPSSITSRASKASHSWFYDSRFDGHFPSRILPFVYLGNLNHASNALMLKALGITHVVSMGESALSPSTIGHPYGSSSSPINSLWHEYANGQIDVLDMKGVADDGIDSIRPHIDRSMEFIEECRLKGGKVLVHCRVGVSRSATIVIGYVMKYLKMDLSSAYLMVRSRRLNILIQPNLLFMWGLRRLESDLVKKEEAELTEEQASEMIDFKHHPDGSDSPPMIQRRKFRMMSWSFLSKEISELNHRYLC